MAAELDLDVRLVDVPGLRYATRGSELWLERHEDSRVVCHRLATAIAQYLLELSNARWTISDVYLLAFELLVPSESVRGTDPGRLASCQPYAVPALVETLAEHASKSA